MLYYKKNMSALLPAAVTFAVVFSSFAPAAAFAVRHGDFGPLAQAHEEDEETIDQQSLRQRIEERRESLRAQTEERLAALDEQRRERITNFFARMQTRFEVLFRTIDRFAERLSVLIDKFENKGKEVTVAREKLAQAQTEIDEAQAAYVLFGDAFSVMLEAERPREAFADMREAVQNVKHELRDVHRALVDVLRELKGASGRTPPGAEQGEGETGQE